MASGPAVDPRGLPPLRGAVPLDPRPAAPARPATGGAPAGGPGIGVAVVDVTDATFQSEVVDRSQQVPVVLDLWASWCGPCKQLSPVLERLAQQSGGAWVLAKVDVDANPRISQALQVQSIPSVFGVVGGQLVPLFVGAQPERVVGQYVEQLLALAERAGLPGPGGTAPPAPAYDEDLRRGDEALDRGDLEAAESAYRALLDREPANAMGQQALARVQLLRRADTPVPGDADEVARVGHAADLAVLQGRPEAGIDALVDLVRRTSGAERDRARQHLLALFEALGPDDHAVVAGRRALANALF